MGQRAYEVFAHTADVGIHAFGRTLPELFIPAAQGMESLVVAPEQVRESVSREIAVEGHDIVSLLIAWLNELIFLFDTEYLLFRTFDINAVTWHEAAVEPTSDGYNARIIFDI